MQSRFILEDEDIVILNDKTVNGGKGSGNFGHSGRPGLVGGSTSDKLASSSARGRRFAYGDIVSIDYDGKTYQGELTNVDSRKMIDIKVKIGSGEEISIPVPTATIVDEKGESHELPWRKVTKIKSYDAPDTTPAERQTKAQKEALAEVRDMIRFDGDFNYFEKNCSEDTAIALRDELKKVVAEGIDLSKVTICHNTRLSRTQARVVYNPYVKGSYLSPLILQLSSKLIADGEGYKKRQRDNFEKGWHTSGDIAGLIRHELGHIKSAETMLALYDKSESSGKLMTSAVSAYNDEEFCRKLVQKVNPKYSVYRLSHGKGKDVSGYAVKDHKYAEVVAESYSNPDFSKVTRAIADELDRQFKSRNNSVTMKFENKVETEEIDLCTGYPMSEEDWEILHGEREEFVKELEK